MRETELWRRLERHLGASYARSWAQQVSLTDLGSRTVVQALADGVDAKRVWAAAWSALDLPASER